MSRSAAAGSQQHRETGTSPSAEAEFGSERSKISPVSCFTQSPQVEAAVLDPHQP